MRYVIGEELDLEGNDKIAIIIEEFPRGLVFLMEGTILENGRMSDWDQNHREIYEKYIVGNPGYPKKTELTRLIEIWKKYEFNDQRPGTEKQMEALDNKAMGYEASLEYLDSIGLKFDEGYEFGTDWFFLKVPIEIIEELRVIIKNWYK